MISAAMLCSASDIASEVWADPEFQKALTGYGVSMTYDDVLTYLTYAAGLALASCVCAGISVALVHTEGYGSWRP